MTKTEELKTRLINIESMLQDVAYEIKKVIDILDNIPNNENDDKITSCKSTLKEAYKYIII